MTNCRNVLIDYTMLTMYQLRYKIISRKLVNCYGCVQTRLANEFVGRCYICMGGGNLSFEV
jgi:hypothetical protein